jgi:hypothetical protein
MAEDYGAEAVGTYDSAFVGGDAFVRATVLALASSRARVGLRPTNPLTREPQVMASFLASLDSLTGGRAFMDIASGDSAVLNSGYKIAREPGSRILFPAFAICWRPARLHTRAARNESDGRPPSSAIVFRSRSAPKGRRCFTWAEELVTASLPVPDYCRTLSETPLREFMRERKKPDASRRMSISGLPRALHCTKTAPRLSTTSRRRCRRSLITRCDKGSTTNTCRTIYALKFSSTSTGTCFTTMCSTRGAIRGEWTS